MKFNIEIPDVFFTSQDKIEIEKKFKTYIVFMMFRNDEISESKACKILDTDIDEFRELCALQEIKLKKQVIKENNYIEEPKVAYLRSKISPVEIYQIIKTFFSAYPKVIRAWLFGSFARQEYDEQSDIDIMIEVDRNSNFSLFDIAEIKYQLEKKILLPVDIVMKNGIRPNILKQIEPDLKTVYEK
jgi:predicted nucleotidyltransferase